MFVWLACAAFPAVNQGCCNAHFCRQVGRREFFLQAFDLNPTTKRLNARGQRFTVFPFSQIVCVFNANSALYNTYSATLLCEESKVRSSLITIASENSTVGIVQRRDFIDAF